MENLVLISYQRLAERSESMINIFEQIKSRVTARQAAEYYGLKVERNGIKELLQEKTGTTISKLPAVKPTI